MSKSIDYFLPLIFFYQNNIIFTSCKIKIPIDPSNPDHSTQPVTRDMMEIDS
jgi:hypothetical protein